MEHLDGKEPLARFIFHKNHYRASDLTVKHSAFIPPQNKQLSVFQILNLSESEIWRIGETIRENPPLGRADIPAKTVYGANLLIDPDNIPPRHANIIGWPEEQSAIKLKAIELAQKATLHLK